MDKRNEKVITIIVCVLLSFSLWVYISNVENVNRTVELKNISVTIENEELAKEYVNHLFVEIIANKEVYSRYCPICKSKNLDEDNSYYYCSDCKAIYTFKKSNDKDTIWLISTRR